MPLAFPSHQGLILPIWRRWPHRFDPVALSLGAAMPDIVDGLLTPIRGELGQGIGHSLIGVLLICTPFGLLLLYGARRFPLLLKFLPRDPHDAHDALTRGLRRTNVRSILGMSVGALSHSLFDLITHANFVLFLPWYKNDDVFPAWWRHEWLTIDLLVYPKPYSIGPHFVSWVLLSVIGIILYLRLK